MDDVDEPTAADGHAVELLEQRGDLAERET
jgi:hypothetical protein